MQVRQIDIRYFPPGISIVYQQKPAFSSNEILGYKKKSAKTKQLDLFSFIQNLAEFVQLIPSDSQLQFKINQFIQYQLFAQNPLINDFKQQLAQALTQITKKHQNKFYKYQIKKQLKQHKQPLTNCAFSKQGDIFATASYDRTVKLWSTDNGELLNTLQGHKNGIFCLDFSDFSEKRLLITGSLDHTCKLWLAGKLMYTLASHSAQVSCVKFNPNGLLVASCSMDNTCRIWDIEKGKSIMKLLDHTAQVIGMDHNYQGDKILTFSFDSSAIVKKYIIQLWDLRNGKKIFTLSEHTQQINCGSIQYTGQLCATGANDGTCIIWDMGSGKPLQIISDHSKQVLDLSFNKIGSRLVTGSADSTVRIYNVNSSACLNILQGHERQVTKVKFNSQGNVILSTGFDGIGRLWSCEQGKNIDVLEGHQDEILSCDISYDSNHIVTVSKDNTAILWKNNAKQQF